MRTAYVGIDVAFARNKRLPVCVCTRADGALVPLPLRASGAPPPPKGRGNAAALDSDVVHKFADEVAKYLHTIERVFRVAIGRIAIDAPSSPRLPGMPLRESEAALGKSGIGFIKTPDLRQFDQIRVRVADHLHSGGRLSAVPHANQLWMLVGFALFSRLRQEWECLEVYPQAIVREIGAGQVHKSKKGAALRQLAHAAMFTGWPAVPSADSFANIAYGAAHDRLDAYLAAWMASLSIQRRRPLGHPPDDVIWVPRIVTGVTAR